MLALDIAAVLVAIGMGLIGAGVLHRRLKKRREKDPRHQAKQLQQTGSMNVVKMEVENERKCGLCGLMTDAQVDLFSQGEWFHRSCFEKFTS